MMSVHIKVGINNTHNNNNVNNNINSNKNNTIMIIIILDIYKYINYINWTYIHTYINNDSES